MGVEALSPSLQKPYLRYQSEIKKCISTDPSFKILEIGSGSGQFTETLVSSGKTVIATDISTTSLDLLRFRFQHSPNLSLSMADMESLPFTGEAFDLVVSAGSLLGDNAVVLKEIYRVLKPGGAFIAVDSLNHNPIYRLNRFIHFLRNRRTFSTLRRMPTVRLISAYKSLFGHIHVEYYGSISWLNPALRIILSDDKIARLTEYIDGFFNTNAAPLNSLWWLENVTMTPSSLLAP